MPAAVVGSLRVLMSADSAQIVSDLGKARAAVKETRSEFATFGRAGSDARRGLVDVTSGFEHEMRGARAAIGLLTVGLHEAGGAGAAEFAKITFHLAHVAEGAGVVGAAMAAIGLSVLAVTKTIEAFRAGNENALAGAAASAKREGEVFRKLSEESRDFADAQIARTRGVSVEEVKLARQIEDAQRAYEAANQTIERLSARGVKPRGQAAWYDVDLSGDEELLSKSIGARSMAEGVLEEAERRIARITEVEARKRADAWANEAEMKTLTVRRFVVQTTSAAERLEAETAAKRSGLLGLPLQLSGLDASRREAKERYVSEQQAALDEQEAHEVAAANHVKRAIDDIRAHFAELRAALASSPEVAQALSAIDRQFDAAEAKMKADAEGAAQSEQARLLSAREVLAFQLRAIEEKGRVDRYALLDREREEAIEQARREGKDVETVTKDYGNRLLQLDLDFATRRAEARREETRAAEDAARALGISRTLAGLDPRDQAGRIRAERAAALDAEDVRYRRLWQDRVESGTSSPEVQALDLKEHGDLRVRIQTDADAALKNLSAETNRGLLRSTEDFQREIENLSRSSLDAQIADENVRYARQVEDLTGRNADLERLEAEHLAKLRAIDAQYATVSGQRRLAGEAQKRILDEVSASFDDGAAAAHRYLDAERLTQAERGAMSVTISGRRQLAEQDERRTLDDPSQAGDFVGGAADKVRTLQANLVTMRELGAQLGEVATNDLAGGVANALEAIARGSKTASEAFRGFATDFAFQVARMIEQALIMKAILALIPGLGGAGAAAGGAASAGASAATGATVAATGAHGGTWRVGGFGGLDSRLVAMKLSPGELVRVTNGANSGGAEPPHVTVVVRPAAVVADTVAEKMTEEAKAGLVATALRRSGRRGMRARD